MKELRAVVSDEEFAEVERFAQGLGVSMGEQNGVRTRREGVMGLIETYQQYRNAGRELNQKIMNQCLEPGVIKASARLLGLAEGETIVFESDREPSVFIAVHLRGFCPVGQLLANPELRVIPGSRVGALGLRPTRTALSGQLCQCLDGFCPPRISSE